jgi:hypothetical protein
VEQNTGMSVSDWSGLVAMVVSLCALVSPMLTAIFNNWHQQKMKQMEYDHQEREERVRREREIYEGYIRAAGAAIQSPTAENLQEYGSHSALAAYYVSEEIQKDILAMDKLISYETSFDVKLDEKVQLLNKIVTSLRLEKELLL